MEFKTTKAAHGVLFSCLLFLSACGGSGGGGGGTAGTGTGSGTTTGYTVGGLLSGLSIGNSITVANNGADNTTLTANGVFAFPTRMATGSAYSFSISALPINQPCSYTYGAGTVATANIGSINLFCGPTQVGSFVASGNLTAARTGFTATVLPNGKVLVAGGTGSTGLFLNSAELYDPATGLWTATGSMATARQSASSTLLPNGNVLVVGGWIQGSVVPTSSAELYDPATGLWSPAGSMAYPRVRHTASLLPNGKVLVAAGWSTPGLASSTELYDPTANSWGAGAPMIAARWGHTATLLTNGKVLVAAGVGTVASTATSAELYDPSNNTWITTGSMFASENTATLLPNGKVLAVGALYSPSAELYDPVTGLWAQTGSMLAARSYISPILLPSGKVLVAGGTSAPLVCPNPAPASLNTAELFDPATGLWTATGNLTTARSGAYSTLLLNGKAIVIGGQTICGGAYTTSTELYW